MSALLENIGTALTGIVGWFTTVLGAIETALSTSLILQLLLGAAALTIGFYIIKKAISVVKSFKTGR